MDHAVDRHVVRGDRRGDRIDQERHVVVDDRQPHPAAAARSPSSISSAIAGVPGGRRAAVSATKRAASARSACIEALDLSRQGAFDQSGFEQRPTAFTVWFAMRAPYAPAAPRGSRSRNNLVRCGGIMLRRGEPCARSAPCRRRRRRRRRGPPSPSARASSTTNSPSPACAMSTWPSGGACAQLGGDRDRTGRAWRRAAQRALGADDALDAAGEAFEDSAAAQSRRPAWRSAWVSTAGELGQPRLVVIGAEHQLDDRRHRRARLRLDPGDRRADRHRSRARRAAASGEYRARWPSAR